MIQSFNGDRSILRSIVMHGSNILLHIRVFTQPLTKLMQDITDYVNLTKAIFHNNALYREIAHSYVSQRNRCVFIIDLKIIFLWFGLKSSRIRYEYSQSCSAYATLNLQVTWCSSQKTYKYRSFLKF